MVKYNLDYMHALFWQTILVLLSFVLLYVLGKFVNFNRYSKQINSQKFKCKGQTHAKVSGINNWYYWGQTKNVTPY